MAGYRRERERMMGYRRERERRWDIGGRDNGGIKRESWVAG